LPTGWHASAKPSAITSNSFFTCRLQNPCTTQ
jgi:hypothetical protein